MKEKGILFSAPMVRAILDNRKTQTRRMVKPQPPKAARQPAVYDAGLRFWMPDNAAWPGPNKRFATNYLKCPYPVGTRVYVKETFCELNNGEVAYRASLSYPDGKEEPESKRCRLELGYKWKPSIFMPKALARIWLEIVAVRVERLQDISEDDAKAEGIEMHFSPSYPSTEWWKNYHGDDIAFASPLTSYSSLWESINGKGSWDLNPWVWAYTFRRIEKP